VDKGLAQLRILTYHCIIAQAGSMFVLNATSSGVELDDIRHYVEGAIVQAWSYPKKTHTRLT
jgi:hypothetical protein